jgi:hypothetical protein
MERFELRLPREAIGQIDIIAAEQGLSRAAVVRRAIGVLTTAEGRAAGSYVGITRDRECLDVVLMGALDVR